MTFAKPFHRNYRAMKPFGPQAGYSEWAYVIDRDYARNPEHYVRALVLIQEDLQEIFEYVEPSDECAKAYSYRTHALFMRTCIEVEANFKAILQENKYKKKPGDFTMKDYKKVNNTHHLSSYEVMLPIWSPTPRVLKPFGAWSSGSGGLAWYQDYNKSKHDRQDEFKRANLGNLVMAVAGLLALVSAQFKNQDYSAAGNGIRLVGYDYHPMEPAIGSLFRITFPNDWTDAEMYEFDWTVLKTQPSRFERIDYDAIP